MLLIQNKYAASHMDELKNHTCPEHEFETPACQCHLMEFGQKLHYKYVESPLS